MSTKYCSNILKIISLAFIAVMAGTELQMVKDVQQYEGRIQSLSNLTLESRNAGYAFVYKDKVKLKNQPSVALRSLASGWNRSFPLI